jgi:uncharacterized protein (DUF302 family)
MKSLLFATLTVFATTLPALAASPGEIEASKKQMQQMQQAQAKIMEAMMLEKQSKQGFNETVDALKKAAESRGWKVTGVLDAQEAIQKAGHKNAKPMKILGMCHPGLAEAVLKAQQKAKMPPALTCRYSVYEGLDGKVYVMRFNTSMMAGMAQGEVAAALTNLAKEEEALMSTVLK